MTEKVFVFNAEVSNILHQCTRKRDKRCRLRHKCLHVSPVDLNPHVVVAHSIACMREGPAPMSSSESSPQFAKPLFLSLLCQPVTEVKHQQGLYVTGKGKHVHIHNFEGLAVEFTIVLALVRAVEVIDMMTPCCCDA